MRNWTRQQLLVAFRLYCTEPFGRLHARNALIVRMAARIGRTPSALAMKACNFASLDPQMVASGRAGLTNASKADEALWAEFANRPADVIAEAIEAWSQFDAVPDVALTELELGPDSPTEVIRSVKVRLVQGFFRQSLLASYDGQCAVTGLAMPELLVASHIVGWAEDERRRADPRNGLLLNALLDKAFDRHLITFDEDLRLVCSRELREDRRNARPILDWEGTRLRMPERFTPDPAALDHHRSLFIG